MEKSNSKNKTSIDLKTNNNILLGKNMTISGYLADEEGNTLVNKGITVYIDDVFVKTLITNGKGFFKDFLVAKFPGKREINCIYEGDWEYEKCSSKTIINIIGDNDDESNDGDREAVDIGSQLEKIANLYQKGLLSDDEFRLAKEKIIKG
ncbi:SHOCT domain-containing protein [Methanobrevibacter sp.]|uniref:SHOCT domain-containing protein n=1 Tax=Methanobrevibacter sp. TaxID=66852 RepID=UPI00388F9284